MTLATLTRTAFAAPATTTATSTAPATAEEADLAAAKAKQSKFAKPADDATIKRTAEALRGKGYTVHVVDDAAAAKKLILSLLPEGAEVNQGASETLEEIGVTDEIEHSGRFDAVRPRTRAMDRTTPEGIRAMRKLGAVPDYFLVSAHALTEDGTLVFASNSGSQLAPVAFGAGEVIFAIGSQKIVPDLETAMRRIEEHSLVLEHARMRKLWGANSAINKLLIIRKEFRAGRFTIVLIKEPVGA
jgi:hypothetical protein